MAWSKWKGACVLTLLASVGVVWSQSPSNYRSAPAAERIMTVHENGKELRCRVIQSWRTSTGSQAHQLQVIATGEMMTIVEDGSPTTVPGSQARAMPMRIFHWGQRARTAPAGAPLPPQTIEPMAMNTKSPIRTTSGQTVTTTGGPCDGVISSSAPRIIGSSNERIIAWDAKTGQPVNVPNCSTGSTVVESPRQGVTPRLLQKPAVAKPAEPKPIELPATAKAEEKKDAASATKKQPFSTATAQSTSTPKTSPLAIPNGDAKKAEQPGLATVDREKIRKDLPPASQTERKKQDILMAPEKFNPASEKVNPKVTAELVNLPAQKQSLAPVPTPLGVQSVLAARNGVQGPVQYIPVPVATVPEPIRPPTPPEPNVPQAPNPTAFVNAFSPPPAQNQQPLTPEQMQVVIQHQALMQQQAFLQQQAMLQRMQYGQSAQLVPVGYGMPMQVNYPAVYGGPQAPNPIAQQPIQQVGFLPPAAPLVNAAMDRRAMPAAAQSAPAAMSDANTVAQIINVLQESPYPAQREWAAMNLASFDWKVYPHLTHVLVQAARQDAVATVRSAAIYSLSRMNAQSEPVLGTLQALRGDADPRVRQEVEQAYIRMGLTPTQP